MSPVGTYEDFLRGVRSTNLLAANRHTVAVHNSAEATKLATGAAGPTVWTTARIAGVAVGTLVALVLVLLGILFVSGIIALATSSTVSLPPPPPPPPPPPLPKQPPLGYSQLLVATPSECQILLSGILQSRVGNGRCEDGGPGSVDNLCPLGCVAAFKLDARCTLTTLSSRMR